MSAASPLVGALGCSALSWAFDGDDARRAGALPPEPAALPYGARRPDSPYPSRDYAATWRRLEQGYRVEPSDCPPVRLIASYGFVVRCPGRVWARRAAEPSPERRFDDDSASFGLAVVGGDEWPRSDSGRVASWIAGSQYVKVQTGVLVYFPADGCLYQGPLPNAALCGRSHPRVMAGVEYPDKSRERTIGGVLYACAMLNVICELPPDGEPLSFERGEPLSWFFPVAKKARLSLAPLDHRDAESSTRSP